MAVTQMNVRIGDELKRNGDEALSDIGLSPTAAVRALWEKAAKRGRDLEEIAELLAPKDTPAVLEAGSASPLETGRASVRDAIASMGLRSPESWELADEHDLLAEAYMDRLVERGLA